MSQRADHYDRRFVGCGQRSDGGVAACHQADVLRKKPGGTFHYFEVPAVVIEGRPGALAGQQKLTAGGFPRRQGNLRNRSGNSA